MFWIGLNFEAETHFCMTNNSGKTIFKDLNAAQCLVIHDAVFFLHLYFLCGRSLLQVLPPSLEILSYSYHDIPQSQQLNSGMLPKIRISPSPSMPFQISVI